MTIMQDELGSGLVLKRATADVGRLILGDGETRGYIYSHPKLSQYFWDQMGRGEQHAWERRFLAYGQATLDALNNLELEPREAPPYVLQQYGAHLERAQKANLVKPAAFYALVTNGWRRAWEAQEGTDSGFLQDVARAWATADEQGDIAIQVRCALCQSSIAALSANMPTELLSQTMAANLLSPVQVLAIVRQTADEEKRSEQLGTAALHLDQATLHEALTVARSIKDASALAKAWLSLAPYQDILERNEVLSEALTAARDIDAIWAKAKVLTRLTLQLNGHLYKQVLGEPLIATQAIDNDYLRVLAFVPLMRQLKDQERDKITLEALETARSLGDEERALALIALMQNLEQEEREGVLYEALGTARKIIDNLTRAEVLATLIPHLAEKERRELIVEVLAIARRNDSTWQNTENPIELATNIEQNSSEEVLSARFQIGVEWARVKSLASIVPYLMKGEREGVLEEALATARKIANRQWRASALAMVAPYLENGEHLKVLKEALSLVKGIHDEWERAKALLALLPYLSLEDHESILNTALATARLVDDSWMRSLILMSLIRYLSDNERNEILNETQEMLHGFATKELRLGGLAVVGDAEAKWIFWADLANALIQRLDEEKQQHQIADALKVIRKIDHEGWRSYILSELVSHLGSQDLEQTIVIIRGLKDEVKQVKAYSALLPWLEGKEREMILAETLELALGISHEIQRAQSLLALVPYLEEKRRDEVLTKFLAATQSVSDEIRRVDMLIELFPYLEEGARKEMVGELLAVVCLIKDRVKQTKRLTKLLLYLEGIDREQALIQTLATVEDISDETIKAKALSQLLPYLPKQKHAEILTKALETTLKIRDGVDQTHTPPPTKSAPLTASSILTHRLPITAHRLPPTIRSFPHPL